MATLTALKIVTLILSSQAPVPVAAVLPTRIPTVMVTPTVMKNVIPILSRLSLGSVVVKLLMWILMVTKSLTAMTSVLLIPTRLLLAFVDVV
jgi:hypothetical protein